MRVAELMQTDVRTIAPESSIAELVRLLAEARVSGLPVVNTDRRVVGVVSAGDVLRAAAEQEEEKARAALFEQMKVRDIMTPNPHVIAPDADAREAARHMLYADVRRLFVEEREKLVGVISQTDIAHAVGTGRL